MNIDGRWRGWYAYSDAGLHHPMELGLSQNGERVSGAGSDDIGTFTIKGLCAEDGALSWLKCYPTHGVDYEGRCQGRFIRGRWRLASATGTFCLWPDGSKPGAVEVKSEQEPVAISTKKGVTPGKIRPR